LDNPYRFTNDLSRDGDYALMPLFGPGSWNPSHNNWHDPHGWYHGIGANTTGGPIMAVTVAPFIWPDNTLWMHPDGFGNAGLAVLSWLAPADGVADLAFTLSDMDPAGGDGVNWYIDLRDSAGNLDSGFLLNNSSGLRQIHDVIVLAGDRINLVITPGPGTNHEFDSTQVAGTISFTAIPEPSTLAVGAIVSDVVLLRRRRR